VAPAPAAGRAKNKSRVVGFWFNRGGLIIGQIREHSCHGMEVIFLQIVIGQQTRRWSQTHSHFHFVSQGTTVETTTASVAGTDGHGCRNHGSTSNDIITIFHHWSQKSWCVSRRKPNGESIPKSAMVS
jgi:hypothetical protein